MLRRLIREPLLHFLLLSGLLFLVFGRGGPAPSTSDTDIVVTAADIDRIAAAFAATWQRPPSDAELKGAIEDDIREEVLYRAGLALGLDKDDTIVRRRIRQKMEFFFEDTVGQPDEAALRAYFAANADKFRTEPRFAFRQVFVSASRSNPQADAEAMLPRLVALGPAADLGGDPFLLPETFGPTPLSHIAAQFGDSFGRELAAAAPGHWIGPLKSAYGYHLVLVATAQPAQLPAFAEVRDVVQREWFAARRAVVVDEQYQKLRARYRVRIDDAKGAP
jgi:parvulin-like peptidyl-prolyl isomerase